MGEVLPVLERIIVVVGASAGGIDALERLATSLPSNFPAPIVIAQHLDPSHESRLGEILRQRTSMRVVSVTGAAPLEDSTIYVVPAGADVEIGNSRVSVKKRAVRGASVPSIDVLFRSAAAAYGDRTIAVILTGTGSDGLAGVSHVKQAGGTVIIQNPATAAYPGLPGAVPPASVDLVSDIDSLGALLWSIVTEGDASASKIDEEMLRAFLLQLRARSGIDFTQYKSPTIKRRLARLMAAARCASLPDYLRYLNANPEAYYRLVSSFLIKVTGFFRDPALYANMREHIIPDLVAQARRERRELRIWSAGCATGEEAYSLAILLSEVLGDEIDELPIRIFATDLDADSIAFARRGLYAPSALTELPPALIEKYFTKADECYQARKRIRNMTVFGAYDLGQRAPFPRIDLIVCRNVLIYFTKELQQRTLQLFAFSLRDAGYLVLGKAETTSPMSKYFACVHPVLKIYRRQGERLLIPRPAFAEGSSAQRATPASRTAQRSFTPQRRSSESAPSLNERLGALLFESDLGIVVIDRTYDIQSINQPARQVLGIHGRGIGDDLIHSVSGIRAADIKAPLDEALRGVRGAPVDIELSDAALDQVTVVRVTCHPDRNANDGSITGVVLLIEDVTMQTARLRRAQSDNEENRKQLQRVTAQNQELVDRQRSLVDANRELTVANSELNAMSEHLLVAAEEAEASAEEVETLNEEMQATTEELETLNEELQATIEELNTTNEELSARGKEFEQLARQRKVQVDESERRQDAFRHALTGPAMIGAVIDGRGVVTNATPPYVANAAANSALPAIGEAWKEIPESVILTLDGTPGRYRVSVIDLPGSPPAEKLIVLSN